MNENASIIPFQHRICHSSAVRQRSPWRPTAGVAIRHRTGSISVVSTNQLLVDFLRSPRPESLRQGESLDNAPSPMKTAEKRRTFAHHPFFELRRVGDLHIGSPPLPPQDIKSLPSGVNANEQSSV